MAGFSVTDTLSQTLELSHRLYNTDEDARMSHTMVHSTGAGVEVTSDEIRLDNTGARTLHGPVTANGKVANPPAVWFQTLDRNPGRRGPLTTPRYIKTRDRLRVYITTSDIRNASGGSDGNLTNFTAGDITVTGGTGKRLSFVNSFYEDDGTTLDYHLFVLGINPTGNRDVVITVKRNSITGTNGQSGPAAAVRFTVTWDPDPPTVEIMPEKKKINNRDNVNVWFQFNENIESFGGNAYTISGGTVVTGFFSFDRPGVAIKPKGGENIVVTMKANSIQDEAGNRGPPSAVTSTIVWDAIAPTLSITGIPDKIKTNKNLTATFTFSEDVTDFDINDVRVTGGTRSPLSEIESGKIYRLTITPNRGSNVVVTIRRNAVTDGLNRGPARAQSATATWDTAAPTVEITGIPAKINATTNLTATFTFNEEVTGFDLSDVTVTNGDEGTFTASSATVYTLGITPDDGEDLTVSVAANSASDGLNTGPATAQSATATWDSDAPTVVAMFTSDLARIDEAADTHRVRVNLSALSTTSITLNYKLSGTATEGVDYKVQQPGTVTIGTNAISVDIPIVIINDIEEEKDETVLLTLINGAGYEIGNADVFTLIITDDDVPILSFVSTIPDQYYLTGLTIQDLVLPEAENGTPNYSYMLTPELPSGLRFDVVTRTLSGIPREATAPRTFTYTATDSDAGTITQTFTIEIVKPDELTFADTIMSQVYPLKIPLSNLILPEATGGIPPYIHTLTPELPTGLAFDPETRTLGGMPLEITTPRMITYTAEDRAGTRTHLYFSMEVYEVSFAETIPNQSFSLGQPIGSLILPELTGGVPPVQYTLMPIDLPLGLRFDIPVRTIRGTPVEMTLPVDLIYKGMDANGAQDSLMFSIEVVSPVSKEETSWMPQQVKIYPNYPNPFQNFTHLIFDLPSVSEVQVEVFDVTGRGLIMTPKIRLSAGWSHEIELNELKLPSGSYLYRIYITSLEDNSISVYSGQFISVQ